MCATRSSRAAALPPQERRSAIIAAVRPLLVEHGDGVTVRQIARAAGVAEGTIFGVFADKDELLDATLAAALDIAAFDAAVEAIDPDLEFEPRLIAAVSLIQVRIVDVWNLLACISPRRRQAAGPMADSVALVSLLEEEAARFRIPPDAAARTLRALTMSLSHPMLIDEARPPAEIVDLFCNGALVRR